jgi:hypothetical protein
VNVSVTYDAQYGRVELHLIPDPGAIGVTVYRNGDVIPRLAYVPLDGPTTLYDYTAPLNQPAKYMVTFHWGECRDSIHYATVTPKFSGWLK